MAGERAGQQSLGAADSYTRMFGGAVPDAERRRLELQGAMFGPLAGWTFDALDLAPGDHVLEVGCGTGNLLALAAERVGPTGRAVGIDRDTRQIAVARELTAAWPWVEVIEADATTYEAGERQFDAAHCRFVLMHQRDADGLLARMIALARPGGRIAAQEYDMDGATDSPALITYPPFAALERVARAAWATSSRRGTDFHAGRKALDRFRRAGLADLRVEATGQVHPLTNPRLEVHLAMLGRPGFSAEIEAAGVMPAAEYERLLAEVRQAQQDPAYDGHLVRAPTVVATVGTKPAG